VGAASVATEAGLDLPRESLYREPWRWTDDRGSDVSLSSFRGAAVVLTMFYTDCPSTCLTTLAKLREIDRAFASRNQPATFVLVSYDSSNETATTLARYRLIHRLPTERWILLAGPEPQVQKLAARIGLGSYIDLADHIIHSYRIVLLDDVGMIHRTLDAKHNRVASLFDDSHR